MRVVLGVDVRLHELLCHTRFTELLVLAAGQIDAFILECRVLTCKLSIPVLILLAVIVCYLILALSHWSLLFIVYRGVTVVRLCYSSGTLYSVQSIKLIFIVYLWVENLRFLVHVQVDVIRELFISVYLSALRSRWLVTAIEFIPYEFLRVFFAAKLRLWGGFELERHMVGLLSGCRISLLCILLALVLTRMLLFWAHMQLRWSTMRADSILRVPWVHCLVAVIFPRERCNPIWDHYCVLIGLHSLVQIKF